MTVLIVRLGGPRVAGEGLRIGTVRRPPRGVPAARFASDDWYDVWYPNLAPSVETMKLGRGAQTEREWALFAKKFRAEMAEPAASRTLDLLAALSHTAKFLGRVLLRGRGALPPVGAARAARGARGEDGVSGGSARPLQLRHDSSRCSGRRGPWDQRRANARAACGSRHLRNPQWRHSSENGFATQSVQWKWSPQNGQRNDANHAAAPTKAVIQAARRTCPGALLPVRSGNAFVDQARTGTKPTIAAANSRRRVR